MHGLEICGTCGGQVSTSAPSCPHCGHPRHTAALAVTYDSKGTLGLVAACLPYATSFLIWFWVGQMNMLQRPGNTLLVLSVGTILATSALVTLEASQLGVGSRLDDRGQLSESPIWWCLGCLALWAVVFPRYLDARKRYGQSSLLWAGIGGVVVFLVSWFWMQDIVADRTQELIRTLQKF